LDQPTTDKDFDQIGWDTATVDACRALVRLAIGEDLGPLGDCTTQALVPEEAIGRAAVIVRREGTIAGLRAAEVLREEVDPRLRWIPECDDGQAVQPGQRVACLEGPAGSLLTVERTLLNVLGRLSGIATLARRYVEAVAGTKARIYDTRKTTPGWRRLEKYAVRCGGGHNHRTGLFDAVLIKDNHLAVGAEGRRVSSRYTPAQAVARARQWIRQRAPQPARSRMLVEIEVDTLEQLEEVLPACPDIILLDNMPPAVLRRAVARRNALQSEVELEASGGVSFETVRAIAECGVDRISVGALTHSAVALDIGLDWLPSAV
jgi:nicotinate-nucleotide pyrophosphorylase (carboxylating)